MRKGRSVLVIMLCVQSLILLSQPQYQIRLGSNNNLTQMEKRKSQSLLALETSTVAVYQGGSLPCIQHNEFPNARIKVDGTRNYPSNFSNGNALENDKDPLHQRVESIIRNSNRQKSDLEEAKRMGGFQCILRFFGLLFTFLR